MIEHLLDSILVVYGLLVSFVLLKKHKELSWYKQFYIKAMFTLTNGEVDLRKEKDDK